MENHFTWLVLLLSVILPEAPHAWSFPTGLTDYSKYKQHDSYLFTDLRIQSLASRLFTNGNWRQKPQKTNEQTNKKNPETPHHHHHLTEQKNRIMLLLKLGWWHWCFLSNEIFLKSHSESDVHMSHTIKVNMLVIADCRPLQTFGYSKVTNHTKYTNTVYGQ